MEVFSRPEGHGAREGVARVDLGWRPRKRIAEDGRRTGWVAKSQLRAERGTRALREDAMAGYRRMDAVPEKERARIRAEGLHYRVQGNARVFDIRQPECLGRGDDFVEDL